MVKLIELKKIEIEKTIVKLESTNVEVKTRKNCLRKLREEKMKYGLTD